MQVLSPVLELGKGMARGVVYATLVAGLADYCVHTGAGTEKVQQLKLSATEVNKKLITMKGIRVTRMPLLAENPSAPIIILIEDVHGSPERELEVLETLRKELGLSHVGFEGWAGKEADEKRGRQILNGEEDLIREMLKDKRFTCIPLEDPDVQLKTLKLVACRYHIEMKNCAELAKTVKSENVRKALLALENIQRSMSNDHMQRVGIEPTQANYDRLITEMEKEMGKPIRVLLGDPKSPQKFNELCDPTVVVQRSNIGIEKMRDRVGKDKVHVSAVVFGQGHTHSIHAHAKKIGGAHILTIEWAPKEDEKKK